MRVNIAMLALLGLMVPLFGCATVYTPVVGVIYTNVKGPVTAEGQIGSKTGKSCATSIMGYVAYGDASISAAANAGGIGNVSTVDHQSRSILGFWGQFCTLVRGD